MFVGKKNSISTILATTTRHRVFMLFLIISFVLLLVLFAAFSDLSTMTIPNWVSISIAACFFPAAFLADYSLMAFAWTLGAAVLVFVVTFGLFALRWMGGGDAKLISALALWFGWSIQQTNFILLVAIYGAVLTVLFVVIRKYVVLPAALAKREWILRLHDESRGIPYGVSIAIAALQVFPATIWGQFLKF